MKGKPITKIPPEQATNQSTNNNNQELQSQRLCGGGVCMGNIERKVYVINRSGHDYSYAERFGQLVYLSRGSMDKYKVGKIARQFAERLADSQPHDYILVTGLTVMAMIAAAIFAFKHGRLNLLIHKPDNTYVAREIVMDFEEGGTK